MQQWYGQMVRFDPDSSPLAWEHYKKYYSTAFGNNYDFTRLFYYNHFKEYNLNSGYYCGRWLNYVNLPLADHSRFNRLCVLEKTTSIEEYKCVEYIEPANRFTGECDFNFNEKKYELFRKIIGNDSIVINKLSKCKEMHHTLVNFSLLQAVGNIQKFKGMNRFDRFDTFVYELDQFYSGLNTNVLSSASEYNKSALISYLNCFNDVYDYCKSIYFIDNRSFVDKIISQGSMPIKTCDDVVRYMNLAEEYWRFKEFYFLRNEFLTIDEYFHNAETYTKETLLSKIESDLGIDRSQGNSLLTKCINRGFIIESTSGIYTR